MFELEIKIMVNGEHSKLSSKPALKNLMSIVKEPAQYIKDVRKAAEMLSACAQGLEIHAKGEMARLEEKK
jgi:hypothetical protein